MLGVAFGLGLGTVAGLSVGPQIFGRVYKPKDYYVLDETADLDEDVQTHENAPVTPEMRRLLEFAEPWTTEPDFQRVSMINRCIKTMWPGLSKAIMEEVLKVVKEQLDVQVFKKFAMVENIVLGSMSMNPAAGPDSYGKYVSGKDFFVGDIPPRLGGFKVYDTSDDEGLFELALLWGSNCKFNVGAFIRLGPVRLYVPVEVSNLHFKADVRITLKPLVEVIPCVGGVAISLLRVPHIDFKLSIIGGVDLMALPVIKDGVRLALRLALNQLMVLPNAMSFPIMPNFGLAKPPKGALNVRLLSADVTKGKELYCVMNTRPSRFRTSNICRAHKGTVEWGEEFNFIIDDPQEQVLHMELWEDVLGSDKLLGYGYLPLGTTDMARRREGEDVPVFEPAQFVKVPMEEHKCAIPLEKVYEDGVKRVFGVLGKGKKPGERSLVSAAAMREKGDEVGAATAERGNVKDAMCGTVFVKVRFIPFFQPVTDEEEEAKKDATVIQLPSTRTCTHNVSDKLKGVLTVHLMRCINLKGENPNSYVRILLSDEDADESVISSVVVSQNSPRYNQKFDFVMINAGSTLHLTVYNKANLTSNVLNTINVFNKKKGVDRDKAIGKLHIPVVDIARNGAMKDIWTLQDTERGQVEMVLSWQTFYFEES